MQMSAICALRAAVFVGDWVLIYSVGMIETDRIANYGDNKMGNGHSGGTPYEERATSEFLDCPEEYRCQSKVDECRDEE